SNALSHEAAAESGNRDGAQCARLQHEARAGDHRRGRTAGGLGSLSQDHVAKSSPQYTSGRIRGDQGRFCADWRSVIAKTRLALRLVPIQSPFHTAWAASVVPMYLPMSERFIGK